MIVSSLRANGGLPAPSPDLPPDASARMHLESAAKRLDKAPETLPAAEMFVTAATRDALQAITLLGSLPPTHGDSWVRIAVQGARDGNAVLASALETGDLSAIGAAFATARQAYEMAAAQIL